MLTLPNETDIGGTKLEALRHCPMLQHAISMVDAVSWYCGMIR